MKLFKFSMVLVLTAILAFQFAQFPNVFSEELSAPEKALTFLRDVAGVSMDMYEAGLKINKN